MSDPKKFPTISALAEHTIAKGNEHMAKQGERIAELERENTIFRAALTELKAKATWVPGVFSRADDKAAANVVVRRAYELLPNV